MTPLTMSPTTGSWKDRAWAKRWMESRAQIERRQESGEWINCDANCYCCRYMVDEGCVDTDEDANDNCPAPRPTPAAITAMPTTLPLPTETLSATTSPTNAPLTVESSPASSAVSAPSTTLGTSTSESTASTPSASQEWVFPAATSIISARQVDTVDAASFGPVHREDSMIVQWTPEDTTPGIQWFCESNSGNRSGGLVSSNQSQPLSIQFNGLAHQANDVDDVYCRLGFTDAPGQTVQWQYINTPDPNGANVISAPANVATAAVATASSLIVSTTSTMSTSPTSINDSKSRDSGLSAGAAAGIGVGVGIIVIVFIILGACFWHRKKNSGPHRIPLWAINDKNSSNSDESGHPPSYSDNQTPSDGVFELPGAPLNPAELPAGIKGTPVMPSELHGHHEKPALAELGSDKDLEEQNMRPRPLTSHPARVVNGEDGAVVFSPSDYDRIEDGTERLPVSPLSGILSSGRFGNASFIHQQIENSPVSALQDREPGLGAGRTMFQRKPIG